jgi:hypothetical protein
MDLRYKLEAMMLQKQVQGRMLTSDDYSTYTLTGGVGLQVQLLLVRLFLNN